MFEPNKTLSRSTIPLDDKLDRPDSPVQKCIKLLVLGASGVGKSTLIHWIKTGSGLTHYKPTLEVMFSSYLFGEVKFLMVTARQWEVGGHTAFQDVESQYYASANAVFILYDTRNRSGRDGAKEKREDIRKVNSEAVIFIVGNPPLDELAEPQSPQDDRCPQVFVDCLNGTGVEELLIRTTAVASTAEISPPLKTKSCLLL